MLKVSHVILFLLLGTTFSASCQTALPYFLYDPAINSSLSAYSETQLQLNYQNRWPSWGKAFVNQYVAFDTQSKILQGGWGAGLSSGQWGEGVNTWQPFLRYAYNIRMQKNQSLSFGLQTSMFINNISVESLQLSEYEYVENVNERSFTSSFGILYKHSVWSMGLTLNNLPYIFQTAKNQNLLPTFSVQGFYNSNNKNRRAYFFSQSHRCLFELDGNMMNCQYDGYFYFGKALISALLSTSFPSSSFDVGLGVGYSFKNLRLHYSYVHNLHTEIIGLFPVSHQLGVMLILKDQKRK
jgi:hypothetical protein